MSEADPAPPPPPARARRAWIVAAALALAGTAGILAVGPGPAPAPAAGGPTRATAAPAPPDLVDRGRALYMTGCVSCHGPDGRGQDAPGGARRGPSLVEAGEAGASYQLTTGRMPLADPSDLPTRKEPAYAPDEIEALVAFVAGLGSGPELPVVRPGRGDLAEGGVLYRENCQACHSATGAGGALSYGRAAPPLAAATPEQVGAAVRSGPGPMPRFGPDILTEEQLDGVARYVAYLEEPDDRGGLALGRLGPIPEGFLVWVGALGLLLVLAYLLGTRWATAPPVDPVPPGEVDPDDPVPGEPVSSEPGAVTPDPGGAP